MSSECNNIKLAIRNDKSEVVCAMCKQCLITANHGVCVLKYVNDMNSCGDKHSANVLKIANQKKHKPNVKKSKKLGFKERLSSPRLSKPRTCLRFTRREGGLVIFQDRYFIRAESKLKPLLLREFHNTPNSGHGGVKEMLVGLSTLFYWKGMRKTMEEFIKRCLVYQHTKYSTQMSLSKGFTVVLVVVDRFLMYAHFAPLPTSFNAHKVAKIFVETIIKLHGIPKTIVSDRDPIFVPLAIISYPPGSLKVAVVDDNLIERDGLLRQLRQNLLAAKSRIEEKANLKHQEVEFNVGDQVLVKLERYRQLTLAKRLSNKLAKRYYGPYKVFERVGKVAYRLALPVDSKIHLVFHVSILKPFSGNGSEEVSRLPEETKGRPIEQPIAVCGSRFAAYPDFNLKDKVVSEGEGNDTPGLRVQGGRRGQR
ncbi:ty3-gypsy retrotransposon protein [Tanacetum coccineum]